MRRKLKDSGGLTFVEMLCAVCILVLLCLMMNTCLGMAVKSYRNITAESEAELLVSSISDALADKLRYCVVTETPGAEGAAPAYPLSIGDVEVDAAGQVTVGGKSLLPNAAYGAYDQFSMSYIGRYSVEQAEDSDGSKIPLVTFDPSANSFTVRFNVKDEEVGITREADFTVRCLNPVKKEV